MEKLKSRERDVEGVEVSRVHRERKKKSLYNWLNWIMCSSNQLEFFFFFFQPGSSRTTAQDFSLSLYTRDTSQLSHLTPQRLCLSLFVSLSSISPCISLPLPVVQWMYCSLWLSLSLSITLWLSLYVLLSDSLSTYCSLWLSLSTYFSLFLSSYACFSLSISKKIYFSHYKSTIVNKYYIFLFFLGFKFEDLSLEIFYKNWIQHINR